MLRIGRNFRTICWLLPAALAAGCAGQEVLEPFTEAGPVWPEPPEAARLQFIGEFSRPEDLGIYPSLWSKVVRMTAGPAQDKLLRPMSVAVAGQANIIYVADPGAGCVHRYDLRSRKYRQLRLARDAPLLSPVGLAVTPDGRVFVSDSQLATIFVAEADDKILTPLRLNGPLQQPTGLAWDATTDHLYVVDTAAQVIRRYATSGSLIAEYGQRGEQAGTLNYPTYLWQDHERNLIVSDSLNFRIQRFSHDGTALGQFGGVGDATGALSRPKGVAADSFGHIYVVDSLFHAVQIFDSDGRFLLAVGQQGQGPGQFWLPAGLFIDAQNTIFVADTHNSRIQVFRYVGAAP
jgi:sugar lactone lactonase YvrE